MQAHNPQEFDSGVDYSSVAGAHHHLVMPNPTNFGSLRSESSDVDSGYDSLGHDGESDGGRDGCMCYACGDPTAAKDEDFLFLFRPLEGHTITLCERTDGQVKEHRLARIHFGNTRYLRQFLKPNLHHRPLKFDVGQLCRDHQRGRCTRGVMCRFLHICRKLPIQAPHPLAASSAGGSRPPSRAASTSSSHSGRFSTASARSSTPEWEDEHQTIPGMRGVSRGYRDSASYSNPQASQAGGAFGVTGQQGGQQGWPMSNEQASAAFLQQLALALAQQPALLAQTAAMAAAQTQAAQQVAPPPVTQAQTNNNALSFAALSLAAANPAFGFSQPTTLTAPQAASAASYPTLTSNALCSLMSNAVQHPTALQSNPTPVLPTPFGTTSAVSAPTTAHQSQTTASLLSSLLNPALYSNIPSQQSTTAQPPQALSQAIVPPSTLTHAHTSAFAHPVPSQQSILTGQQQSSINMSSPLLRELGSGLPASLLGGHQGGTSAFSGASPAPPPTAQPSMDLEEICRQLRSFATSFHDEGSNDDTNGRNQNANAGSSLPSYWPQ